MEVLFDGNGFYKIELFILISLALLYVVHKKGIKYIFLPIIPLLLMPLYQNHIEEELVSGEQSEFITNSFGEVYNLHGVDTKRIDSDNEIYDTWEVNTTQGNYFIRFNKGASSGFEIFETHEGAESLTARKNIISVMDSLDIDGVIEYKGENKYIILYGEDELIVEMNERNRVNEVVDSDGRLIYMNEEELSPEDGQILESEGD